MSAEVIRIVGARQNNLKDLSLDLPLHELIVITGVSGSGKSSLAFDTLYAEGTAALCGKFFRLRPAVPGAYGQAPGRAGGRHSPGYRH